MIVEHLNIFLATRRFPSSGLWGFLLHEDSPRCANGLLWWSSMRKSLLLPGFVGGLVVLLACPEKPTDFDRFARDIAQGLETRLDDVDGIKLRGFNHTTLLGFDGFRVLVVSALHASELLLFAEDGALLDRHSTTEVLAVHLCRTGVPIPYFLTEELDLSGTGVVEASFRAYTVAEGVIREVWSGPATSATSLPDEMFEGEPPLKSIGWLNCFEGLQHSVLYSRTGESGALEVSSLDPGKREATLVDFSTWDTERP